MFSDQSSPAQDTASRISIELRGLGKTYHLYATPRDRLKQMIWSRLRPGRQFYREFHALRDIDLDIARGEVLGIVGRNGAGKSTLLQLVSQTLTPSAGHIRVNGRIAALLELGAGFSPDFTGRENVFMNAAILGLSQAEIQARYEDIVAFAGIGAFIDQPVKTYSSGMFVRLAFAVASSIEPDILIIDEALSVGDGEFARKSFDRIMDLKKRGVTILFCSHSLYQVEAFCNRALWLDGGCCRMLGDPGQVVSAYSQYLAGLAAPAPAPAVQSTPPADTPQASAATPDTPPNDTPLPPATAQETSPEDAPLAPALSSQARFEGVEIALDDIPGRNLRGRCGQSELRVTVRFASDPQLPPPVIGVVIDYGSVVAASSAVSRSDNVTIERDAQGRGGAEIIFPNLALRKGEYRVSVYLTCENAIHFYDEVATAAVLHLEDPCPEPGLVVLPHFWRPIAQDLANRVMVHGQSFAVDAADSLGLLASDGIFEPEETALCRQVVTAGQRVLDIGANIGYYTVLLTQLVGEHGRVTAVEPDADNFRLLRRNCAAGVGRGLVHLRQAAMGREPGQANLYRAPDSGGMHRLYSSVCCGSETTSVTVLRGDDLDLAPLDFLKIDIEGYEPAALDGLEQTMAASPALSILCEFSPLSLWEAGFIPQDFLRRMDERGFIVLAQCHGQWLPQDLAALLAALDRLPPAEVRAWLNGLQRMAGQSQDIERAAIAFLTGHGYDRPVVESLFFTRAPQSTSVSPRV